jgi:MoxR-like ATPase
MASVHTTGQIDLEHAFEVVQRFQRESTKWLYGLDEASRILSWAFFTLLPYTDKLRQTKALRQPHVLLKGPTGTGKTDLVSACAMAMDAKFERIQGLPTYMPEDILGYETIVEELDGTRKIHFKPGKLLAHIVLIDEDNRLTAKTKAAVLESMEESSATLSSDYSNVAGTTTIPLYPLSCDLNDIEGPRFFMVICTENIFGEEEGTFPNPVAQLDRTTLAITMGDPDAEDDELKIVAHNVVGRKIERLTNLYEVLDIANFIYQNVRLSDYAQQYKVRLIRNTRPHRVQGRAARTVKEYIRVGISPRVHFHLEAVARTFAFFNGEMIITPDHIKAVARHVLAHRLVLREGMEFSVSKEEVLDQLIREMEVPPWK